MILQYGLTVSVPSDEGESLQSNSVIANAAKYLAYADQTDTFGYHGNVVHAHKMKTMNDDGSSNVYMRILVPIPGDDYRQEFEDELDRLAHVRSYVMVDDENESDNRF
jgi:hypothetical protein